MFAVNYSTLRDNMKECFDGSGEIHAKLIIQGFAPLC